MTDIVSTQLRIPRPLLLAVKHAAVDAEMSANKMILTLISEALAARHEPLRTPEQPVTTNDMRTR